MLEHAESQYGDMYKLLSVDKSKTALRPFCVFVDCVLGFFNECTSTDFV